MSVRSSTSFCASSDLVAHLVNRPASRKIAYEVLRLLLQQAWGFSREFSFVTAPRVGRDASVRFLAVADLGHAETDGSAEIDHDQAKDMLNYTPVDTLQYVRAPLSHPLLLPSLEG